MLHIEAHGIIFQFIEQKFSSKDAENKKQIFRKYLFTTQKFSYNILFSLQAHFLKGLQFL